MANNYVDNIATSLTAFTNNDINPSVKDSIYRSLGWGGLFDTDIFGMQPHTCDIRAINQVAKQRNLAPPFTPYQHPECGLYNISASILNLKDPCY